VNGIIPHSDEEQELKKNLNEADKYIVERERMVEDQLVARGIKDPRVLKAFREIPRHAFVSDSLQHQAYNDYPLPLEHGQAISQPYMVALMTECLHLKGDEKVLEVGTGSGYQAAILARLARRVYSIERDTVLARKARELLTRLKFENVVIKVGDGTLGWREFAPYDGIIVTAGSPLVPEPLQKQLRDAGRLVVPVGSSAFQNLMCIEKKGTQFKTDEICGCTFVPLIGDHGWAQE
jgi:protein-L-isoaspartate(D-aspartate) O-methyltransferase